MKKDAFRKGMIVIRKDCPIRCANFFMIQEIEGKFIYCKKCGIDKPSEYLYTFRKEDVTLLKKGKVQMTRFIKSNLDKKLKMFFIKKTKEIEALKNKKLVSFYKKSIFGTKVMVYPILEVKVLSILAFMELGPCIQRYKTPPRQH